MQKFSLTVNGIERQEYYHAARQIGRRLWAILALAMVVICVPILFLSRNFSVAAFLGPVVVFAVVVAGYELVIRLNYKDQLAVLDPPMEYSFHGGGWRLTRGGDTAEFSWTDTPRMRKTSRCVFLYSDDTTSNLIPRRLLAEGQLEALEYWYKNSRTQAKRLQKQKERERRQSFRDRNGWLRFGRTGPVWGPWKRK